MSVNLCVRGSVLYDSPRLSRLFIFYAIICYSIRSRFLFDFLLSLLFFFFSSNLSRIDITLTQYVICIFSSRFSRILCIYFLTLLLRKDIPKVGYSSYSSSNTPLLQHLLHLPILSCDILTPKVQNCKLPYPIWIGWLIIHNHKQ